MLKIIGHRGAKGLAPENTLEAIEAGIAAGVDIIEIDIRVTKDSVPILSHYKRLLTDNGQLTELVIADSTLADLQAAKPSLPTLEDAIRAIKHRKPIFLDIKPRVPYEPIVSVLQTCLKKGWQPKEFTLGSFSQSLLRALHVALPECPTWVIEHWSGVRASWRCRELGTKDVTINQHFLWWFFIQGMHRSKYHLLAYVLDDPRKAKRWAAYGLYGVITDHPERFRRPSGTAKD